MSEALQRRRSDHGFFGQPRALANIFGVEMWERFSFYGMQGILLIYLYYSAAEGGLGLDQATATSIVGAYGGTVYLSTIAGAWLADRLVGPERVLFASGVVVLAGHVALAVLPGLLGVGVGLVLIALGSGGVKATATTIVGTLYAEGDERRDAGFSLFYLGINLGALVGPLLTGLLRDNAGFHYGFGLAAVGMAAGLVQYSVGRRRLPEQARRVPDPLPADRRRRVVLLTAAALAVVVVLCLVGVVTADRLDTIVATLVVVASVFYFSMVLGSRRVGTTERRRVLAFIPLFLASVMFWALFQQQFTVVTVYSDQRLDRTIAGWEMPVAWVQSINPVFIIALAPVFAAVWTKLGNRQPSTPVKFAVGTALMGVAFLLFLPMAGGGPGSAPLLGLIGILLVFTLAELFLSPVGLSVTTKLAPAVYRTQLVALFYLSIALGTALAGTLAAYYSPETERAYFGFLGGTAIAIGAVLLLLSPLVRRLMSGVR
ncbi:peptide MFS transporter [Kineococcus arenarius]|uniref:peptide MFS transporter n=1 Tax=Kineococcus sp. SYSU DK007 TaxID=3383128 RepID=UPI003D7C5200